MKKYLLLFMFVWMWMRFNNLYELTDYMNKLSSGQAISAKIICEPMSEATFCRWYLVYDNEGKR